VGKLPWASPSGGSVSRLFPAALLAGTLVAGPPGAPQAFSVDSGAQAGLRALWAASVAGRAERVACLASVINGDTLHITRVQALTTGADSLAVSALASLEHAASGMAGDRPYPIPLREGQRASPCFRGRTGCDADVVAALEGRRHLLPAVRGGPGSLRDRRLAVVILPSARY